MTPREQFQARVIAAWTEHYRVNKVKGPKPSAKSNGLIQEIFAAFDEAAEALQDKVSDLESDYLEAMEAYDG